MAAATGKTGGFGTEIRVGQNRSIITANETNALKATSGKVASLLVYSVGTTWVIDIYDDPTTTNNKIYSWVTADGKGVFALQCPMAKGITVVSSGVTPGAATVIWS